MTTFPDCSPRHGLLELARDSGRRAGYIRGTCEPSHDVGCDGNSGGLPKARGLAVGRTRALRGTPVDEGDSEVPSAARSPTMSRSVSLPGWWYEMACNLVMDTILSVHLPTRSATTKTPYQKHHETGSFTTPGSTNTHTRCHRPQTCMCGVVKENVVWNQAKLHKETAKRKTLATLGQMDRKDHRNTEGCRFGRLDRVGREGEKDTKRSMDPTLMSLLAQL